MTYRTQTFYTDKQKSEMWDRWQRCELMSSIERHFNRASSSIFPHLARSGGIRPADRTRARCALSLIEQEVVSHGLVAKQSFRSIAQSLNRSPSTISGEVRRNCGRKAYRAAPSDQRAWDCATRPKLCKLAFNDPLCQLTARKLRWKWSPQQIAGWLKRKYPDEEHNRVSHALPAFTHAMQVLPGDGTGYCAAMSREENDISQPLCPNPRGLEEGIAGMSAQPTCDPTL